MTAESEPSRTREPMTGSSCAKLVGETAGTIVALVHAGAVSPEQLVQAHLARISAVDPQLGAFQHLRCQEALDEAERLGAHPDLRNLPLAGVPIAIKDNVAVSGVPMRIGSRATANAPTRRDHPAVQRLRAAGAIVLGTTRVSELCTWADCDSAFGATRNPWKAARTPGGSSGGSASAVAAGMVPLALGADGMGSIRIPAACCGVVGFKPGSGVVPAMLGQSAWFGMAENGPFATTVTDTALMLSVLAGRPELCCAEPPKKPLRVAVSVRAPLAGITVDREIAAAVCETGELLATAGHTVEQADPPSLAVRSVIAILARWFAGVAQDADGLDKGLLERRTRTHARLGSFAQALHLIRAQDHADWCRRHESFYRRFDLLITPVVATAPPRADGWSGRSWTACVWAEARFAPFTAAWNFAGGPAAAVPAGLHSDGTPLAVQLVAPPGGEATILAIARQLEMLRPWPRHPIGVPDGSRVQSTGS